MSRHPTPGGPRRRAGRAGLVALALSACLVGLAGSTILAQEATGLTSSLVGRVVDPQGEGLPVVTLTLTNPTLSIGKVVKRTDLEGHFAFDSLLPGDGYEITASIPDFATVIAGPLRLAPGRATSISLTLRPSTDMQEVVRVEARGAVVDLSDTSAGTSFSPEFIEGIPIIGRQFEDLLTLAPGVTDVDGDGNPNVHGARDTSFQLRLDGTNISNPLTGLIGQNINLETIEDLEIITAGATAEYGRASGGFANIITRSGGNEFTGSFKAFYRSDFLDGDGANDEDPRPEFTDTNLYVTAGGPIVRNHLWYFASVERLDEEVPVIFPDGGFAIQDREGYRGFGKVTWQASPEHRLAFQANLDPIDLRGNNIGLLTAPETDFELRTGGPTFQFTWSAVISPQLLLQSIFSHMNGRYEIDPISPAFRTIDVEPVTISLFDRRVPLPCENRNCAPDEAFRRFSEVDQGRFQPPVLVESGPWNERGSQDLDRTTMKADLAYTLEDAFGQHSIKSGFEANVERYDEQAITNPILTDKTCLVATECPIAGASSLPPNARLGSLVMEVFDPSQSTLSAEGLAVGAYIQDSWKPRANIAVSGGFRYDVEEIDTRGRTFFDPAEEARTSLAVYDAFCDAAGPVCTGKRTPGRRDGPLPDLIALPDGHPGHQYDTNGNGILEIEERLQIVEPFTTEEEWLPASFEIRNKNLAPRLSLSWDPWADGKTKFFGTYGVFYDRIFLGAVTTGQQPESHTAQWRLGFFGIGSTTQFVQADPGSLSETLSGPAVNQVDRDVDTPYTIEITTGFEREIAPEWSIGLTYIDRRGIDLLQDIDVNHITCAQFDVAFGVDPYAVCGDGGFLELDRFGMNVFSTNGQGTRLPNGAPDLYSLNPNFNQVLRVENANRSDYMAWEVILRRRLHRNWQMQLSYTWSEARGEAESFDTLTGNDAAVSDRSSGYLDYDQRHVVKWQGVVHLQRGLLLGGAMEWASGLPYSLIGTVTEDYDDFNNLTAQRIFSATGERNDQRNQSVFTLNGRIEKRFTLGRYHASAFLEGENLLDGNDLRLLQVDRDAREIVDGTRRFGRRWEIGCAFFF